MANYLEDVFYKLIDEGFIYDEDENGLNMSYGEYIAISDYIADQFMDKILEKSDIVEMLEYIEDTVKGAGDDVFMFCYALDDYDELLSTMYYDEDIDGRSYITLDRGLLNAISNDLYEMYIDYISDYDIEAA